MQLQQIRQMIITLENLLMGFYMPELPVQVQRLQEQPVNLTLTRHLIVASTNILNTLNNAAAMINDKATSADVVSRFV